LTTRKRVKRPARGAWAVGSQGLLPAARQVPSPNFDERPEGSEVDLLVVHAISLPPGEFGGDAVLDFFTNRLDPAAHPYFSEIAGLRVSSHFFIRRSGELIQFVSCAKRAWHAGQSQWRGRNRCNDFSIGVELEGSDAIAFSAQQYEKLERLTRALQRAFPIAGLVGHCDIALPPGRKTDPGPNFDWSRFAGLTAR
jgi:N-acetyl-anhydromuramoyl-L-alanine amidase